MSSSNTTTQLNEGNIAQAISFLKDSRVINTSINKKIEFLKNKKLTIAEISESFKRAYPNSTEWKDILAVYIYYKFYYKTILGYYSCKFKLVHS